MSEGKKMSNNTLSVITGATGHVGYALLLGLINNGEKTRVVAINERDGERVADLNCEIVYGDVTNLDTLVEAFKGADVVYHLAGMVEIKAGYEDLIYNVNVKGTKNVVEACKKCGVKKLVYMSRLIHTPRFPTTSL